ncbi:uncharacterized protein LOC144335255 isoform X2 [Macaca mulatta]
MGNSGNKAVWGEGYWFLASATKKIVEHKTFGAGVIFPLLVGQIPILQRKFRCRPDTVSGSPNLNAPRKGHLWGHSKKAPVCKPGGGPSPETSQKLASTLISGFQSQNNEKTNFCWVLDPICNWHPNETVSSSPGNG